MAIISNAHSAPEVTPSSFFLSLLFRLRFKKEVNIFHNGPLCNDRRAAADIPITIPHQAFVDKHSYVGAPRPERFASGTSQRHHLNSFSSNEAESNIYQETRIVEQPIEGELQIAIKTTGICGSDVSYYKKFANGDLCACAPLSLGHESSGVVVAIGPKVSNFRIGDRVALEVGIPCGECGICRKGRYNLCKKMRFRSSAKSVPHFQGTLQERINHPAKWCHRYYLSWDYGQWAMLTFLQDPGSCFPRCRCSP
jgi:hypothetical protein